MERVTHGLIRTLRREGKIEEALLAAAAMVEDLFRYEREFRSRMPAQLLIKTI